MRPAWNSGWNSPAPNDQTAAVAAEERRQSPLTPPRKPVRLIVG